MPGGVALGLDVCNGVDYGAVTTASIGTNLIAGATVNTKGSWVQLGSPVGYDISWVHVNISQQTVSNRSALIDIGISIGSSGVFTLISNICAKITVAGDFLDYVFPLDIPAGTTLWAREQSSTASDALHYIKINGYSGGATHPAGHSGGEGIGVSLSTSLGTLVTANAAGNTVGSYAQLTAATPRDYSGLLFYFEATSSTTYLVNLAIGASGSEQIIMPNIAVSTSQTVGFYMPISIPAGTRIAASCQCAAAAADTGYCALVGMFR